MWYWKNLINYKMGSKLFKNYTDTCPVCNIKEVYGLECDCMKPCSCKPSYMCKNWHTWTIGIFGINILDSKSN